MNEKLILDACCGSRMFWFNKANPLALFADIRDESHILCDGRTLQIKPDMRLDFRELPFPEGKFKLVVFDPPHLRKAGLTGWMAKKYGVLNTNWRQDIKQGFDECMRVLADHGVLIFKWSTDQIKVAEVIKVVGQEPLFGHTTGRSGKTIWMAFMKMPEEKHNGHV